jgi:tetrahydromethanopterin S-methyltransferase subunit B
MTELTHTTLASSYAAAVKKDEDMVALAMTSSERIDALEKRVAKLEACLSNPKALWDAVAAAPVTLPPAPATDTDPAA